MSSIRTIQSPNPAQIARIELEARALRAEFLGRAFAALRGRVGAWIHHARRAPASA